MDHEKVIMDHASREGCHGPCITRWLSWTMYHENRATVFHESREDKAWFTEVFTVHQGRRTAFYRSREIVLWARGSITHEAKKDYVSLEVFNT